jgi:hypothetical protein
VAAQTGQAPTVSLAPAAGDLAVSGGWLRDSAKHDFWGASVGGTKYLGDRFGIAASLERRVSTQSVTSFNGSRSSVHRGETAVLGGLRARSSEDDDAVFFGQVLAGLNHRTDDSLTVTRNAFALEIGAGLDFRVARRVFFRALAAQKFLNGTYVYRNSLHIDAGVVFALGRR